MLKARHSGESRNPYRQWLVAAFLWIPVFTGMTSISIRNSSAETIRASSGRDRGFCEVLSRHLPREDVMFKPDSDVPADIAPSIFKLPDEVVFPLTVNLAEYFGVNVPAGVILEPELGVFRIRGDGSVFWNETELTDQSLAYCGFPPVPERKPESEAEAYPPAPPQELLEEEGGALYGAYPE